MNTIEKNQFFCLVPEESFYNDLMKIKKEIYQEVGKQQYLLDIPHLTLYVGDFVFTSEKLASTIKSNLQFKEFELNISELKTFCNDPITKKNTIVLPVASTSFNRLRVIQKTVVDIAKNYRKSDIISRYKDYKKMSNEFQRSVESYGFPFVGDIWKPHFTFGSFDAKVYPRVVKMLEKKNFTSNIKIKSLFFNHIYESSFEEIWKING